MEDLVTALVHATRTFKPFFKRGNCEVIANTSSALASTYGGGVSASDAEISEDQVSELPRLESSKLLCSSLRLSLQLARQYCKLLLMPRDLKGG